MKKKTILLLFFSLLVYLHFSCNTTEPLPEVTITLKLEDASSIEAWINLTTSNLQLPTTITLKQNNQTRNTINLVNADTLLYIDSLLPNTTYNFQATSHSGLSGIASNQLQVITMDTTSHNFTWQSWTFGEHGSSALYDVAIINENNIWAVGEIFLNDSLGQPDQQPYAVAHWNGTDWTLMKVPYHDFNQTVKHPGPLFSIAVISNEIYVASYANLLKRTGSDWEEKAFFMRQIPFDGQILKIWGNDENNIYCVGRNGAIYYYFGIDWQKLESGVPVDLTDVYGTPNGSEVWACGWNNSDGHTVLLRVNNNQSDIIYDSFNPNSELPYNGFISSLWTIGKGYFLLTGSSEGIVKHSYININIATKENFEIQYFPYRIRGNECNDISLAGDASILWHFNGSNWKRYEQLLNINDRLRSMNMKGDIIVSVGRRFDGILTVGLIIMGRR